MTPFYCKECRQIVAINHGDSIAIGDALFFEAVKFRHSLALGGCGRVNKWYPVKTAQSVEVRNAPQRTTAEAAIIGDFN
jgi:hypothetical protein